MVSLWMVIPGHRWERFATLLALQVVKVEA
jgi:hypothetical protein